MSQTRPLKNAASRLTELDRHLLAILKQDSRRTYSEMASMLKVSRTTVKDRMDRLQETGIIKRFTIEVAEEDEKPVNGLAAFFHLQLRRPVCKIISQAISGWPEIVGCWSIAGDTDMSILVNCSTDEELEQLRDRLARHPEVKTLWTAMVLRQWMHRSGAQRNHKSGDQPDLLDRRLEEIAATKPNLFEKYGDPRVHEHQQLVSPGR